MLQYATGWPGHFSTWNIMKYEIYIIWLFYFCPENIKVLVLDPQEHPSLWLSSNSRGTVTIQYMPIPTSLIWYHFSSLDTAAYYFIVGIHKTIKFPASAIFIHFMLYRFFIADWGCYFPSIYLSIVTVLVQNVAILSNKIKETDSWLHVVDSYNFEIY